MEKEIGSKVVKMQVDNEQSQKLSYEKLNQVCAEMSQQIQQQNNYIQQLHKKMQEMNFILQNKRMEYLFRVVELHNNGRLNICNFETEFVQNCIAEIQEALTIPQQEEEKEETPNEN